MVGTAGFEPTTPTPPVWCATWLRYAPTREMHCFAVQRGQIALAPRGIGIIPQIVLNARVKNQGREFYLDFNNASNCSRSLII